MHVELERAFVLTVSEDEAKILLAGVMLIASSDEDDDDVTRVIGERGISVPRGIRLAETLGSQLTRAQVS
jgi:hypothetical protein